VATQAVHLLRTHLLDPVEDVVASEGGLEVHPMEPLTARARMVGMETDATAHMTTDPPVAVVEGDTVTAPNALAASQAATESRSCREVVGMEIGHQETTVIAGTEVDETTTIPGNANTKATTMIPANEDTSQYAYDLGLSGGLSYVYSRLLSLHLALLLGKHRAMHLLHGRACTGGKIPVQQTYQASFRL
jgi:hypothetical protein